eukprot:359486-Chlamydomonas_euryale.AAC.5
MGLRGRGCHLAGRICAADELRGAQTKAKSKLASRERYEQRVGTAGRRDGSESEDAKGVPKTGRRPLYGTRRKLRLVSPYHFKRRV